MPSAHSNPSKRPNVDIVPAELSYWIENSAGAKHEIVRTKLPTFSRTCFVIVIIRRHSKGSYHISLAAPLCAVAFLNISPCLFSERLVRGNDMIHPYAGTNDWSFAFESHLVARIEARHFRFRRGLRLGSQMCGRL